AHGELMMLGAILTGVISATGMPSMLSAVLAALCCVVASAAFYVLVIRPAKQASMAQVVILTVGFAIVIRGGVTAIWGTEPFSVPPFSGAAPLRFGGVSMLPQELWLIGSLIVIAVAIAVFFRKT